MATAQQNLFEPAALPAPPLHQQRWWRLQGQARRSGRRVEPLLVTPRFLARIDTAVCPLARSVVGPRAGVVVALRADADLAAGHLATVGPEAASAASSDGDWAEARATAERLRADGTRALGLDAAGWRRLAVLRSFVQALTPAEVATLPLHVLPPNRLRVLSPVQGLQVAATLALRGPDRAERLSRLAALAEGADLRLALRVFVLTLLARRPADLDDLAPAARRHALEDLWEDSLLQRRWQRLALHLTDAAAADLLLRARAAGCLGRGWRPLDAAIAIDGWEAPARSPRTPVTTRRRQRPESADVLASPLAAPGVADPVLAAVRGRHGADAGAAAAVVA